jgi:hypothetical protein
MGALTLPPGKFRVFGSPFALQTLQMATYLRHLGVPCSLHTQHAVSSVVTSLWYGAADSFSTVAPDGRKLASFLDVVDYCEPRCRGNVAVFDCATHPWQRTVSNVLQMYALWWLMCTGGYFRWVHGEGSSAMRDQARYFLFNPAMSSGLARLMRVPMQQTMVHYGMSTITGHFVQDHFARLCRALDKHFEEHDFLLGTAKPSVADCLFGASFNGQFLVDDPPRGDLVDGSFSNLLRWAKVMEAQPEETGKEELKIASVTEPDVTEDAASRGSRRRKRQQDAEATEAQLRAEQSAARRQARLAEPLTDSVPDTLEPVLELAAEVYPWLISQADATRTWFAAQPAPTDSITLLKLDPKADSIAVRAHKVKRLLDQPWTMAVDDASLDCQVSIFHLASAQRLARDTADIALDSPARVAPARESSAIPLEAVEYLQGLSSRCDTGLSIAPVTLRGTQSRYAIWSPVQPASVAAPSRDGTERRL